MVADFDTIYFFKAQSDDDDVGPDDVAVNVEGRDGFMDAFFGEVSKYPSSACQNSLESKFKFFIMLSLSNFLQMT